VSAQPTAAAAGTIGIGGDLTVNRMGFGAMRITGRGIWGEPPSRDQAIATLRRVVELGVNFIDTADSYGPSVSEELIAEALYPYPDELVIATKGGLARPGPNRWNPDGRPEHLREACEGSLRRLRLEQIALWQFHRPDPKVPLAESIGAIAELKDEGKIRHVGISNVSEAQFREAERILPIVSIQNRFNVTDRESEALIDLCEQEDMVFLPWAPIQQADRRVAVAVAAERRDVTERQIVLAWLLATSPVVLPIPGTGSPEHAEENVAATAIELSADEIEAISKGGLSRRADAQCMVPFIAPAMARPTVIRMMPRATAPQPSINPASARPDPCSPVRLIWPRAMWPNTIAGIVPSGPNTNCASPQARLAIANPLVLAVGLTTVSRTTGRSAVSRSRSAKVRAPRASSTRLSYSSLVSRPSP